MSKRGASVFGMGLAAIGFATISVAARWPQAAEVKKPSEPLKHAPRAFFRDHCQRCHGVDGSNFVSGFADHQAIEKLRADIKRMAEGPGGAPLKDEEIDVQAAFLRLVSKGKPFLSWTDRKGTTLSGEASDGAKVTATIGDVPIDVKVDDDSNWTITLPNEQAFAKLSVTATLEKATIALKPAERPFAQLPEEEKPGAKGSGGTAPTK